MRTKYKNYTFELDIINVGENIPTKIIDTGMIFNDVSQAKTWVDNNPKEEGEGDDKNER